VSIYATWLCIDDDDEHGEPWVYEGSHILPQETDLRGGWLEFGAIPDHIEREGVPGGKEGERKDWCRIGIGEYVTMQQRQAVPGEATVILHREQVRELRDTLSQWLAAEEVA